MNVNQVPLVLPYYRIFELWTFRSQDHSLPGAKLLGVELSLPGTFSPWYFPSEWRMERTLPPANRAWNGSVVNCITRTVQNGYVLTEKRPEVSLSVICFFCVV